MGHRLQDREKVQSLSNLNWRQKSYVSPISQLIVLTIFLKFIWVFSHPNVIHFWKALDQVNEGRVKKKPKTSDFVWTGGGAGGGGPKITPCVLTQFQNFLYDF